MGCDSSLQKTKLSNKRTRGDFGISEVLRPQSFVPTCSRTEMIGLTSGHLQAHYTRVDLSKDLRVPRILSVDQYFRRENDRAVLTLDASANNTRSGNESPGPQTRVYCTLSTDTSWVGLVRSKSTAVKGDYLDPNSYFRVLQRP